MNRSLMTLDQFTPYAKTLRKEFDSRMSWQEATRPDRFVWDFFHIPDQYTHLRTPAYHFFSANVYEKFHNQLVWWGRRNLGCHDISPPWLSCYVEGCKQELHGDLPHGPWAFVFSLTPWKGRRFSGGETVLLKDSVLSYWQNSLSQRGLDKEDLFQEIPPLFNRLLVFDPRIPHGVRETRGTMDPAEGRLVIHGWFVQPRPFIEGPLSTKSLEKSLSIISDDLRFVIAKDSYLQGTIAFRFQVTPSGKTKNVTTLSNTLQSPLDPKTYLKIQRVVTGTLEKLSFSKNKKASWVTLPLVFEAN
ncbi:MAG: 2OG-Fe(II) oxygenase [Pseudobdellovibrionaceae bacterium]